VKPKFGVKPKVCVMLSLALIAAFVLPAFSQSSADPDSATFEQTARTEKKTKGPGKEMAQGGGDIGKGAAKGTVDLAKGAAGGVGNLATGHPISAGTSVGKGAAGFGKNVGVGTGKGVAKIGKGMGGEFKKLGRRRSKKAEKSQ
jgi:hypothetical protein